ncbi:amidohydrolase [Nocardioides donggukensis]|uniref:Amidohydrolase family protein n=1 Tax=Nocardioides donggukensis TaxID=2774019 RepID=A0A927K3T2_9ACTN|nr:amidohydrolase family protein [Nocardioides donggukensis]MBD8869542.1 amidohydrolase family protein [Nocardioides donggukensis]
MTRLLRGGVIHTPEGPATAMAVAEGRIVFVGDEDRAERYTGADEVVDLEGRLVTPAFVDAHAHLVQTGEQLGGLDLTGCGDLTEALDRVADHASRHPESAVVVGAGWDETTWPDPTHPTADLVERAAPGRRVYLARVDGHSAVVSHGLLAEAPGAEDCAGWSPDGWVDRDAKLRVTDRLGNLIGPGDRLAHARLALRTMAGLGIAAVHENAAPHIGPDWEIGVVREAAAEVGVHVTTYWGALASYEDATRLGVAGLAGDLNADGAVGSRTAALRQPYRDQAGHCGHGFLDAAQVAEHVVGCTERGIQAGFHCIGDAALDEVGAGFARAAELVGAAAIRARRHRLEHCEMPSEAVVRTLAELGVVASVQPMFDDLWGGPEAMYAERLGERWRVVNPFGDLHRAGLTLAFGSDSPVTPLDPWGAVRAAVNHRTAGQELDYATALFAHTRGGWAAAGIDDAGVLTPGSRASYAIWDATGLPDPARGAPSPACLTTVVDGRTIHAQQRSTPTPEDA